MKMVVCVYRLKFFSGMVNATLVSDGEGDDTERQRSGLETGSRAQVRFSSFFSVLTFIIYELGATNYHCTPQHRPLPPRAEG